MTSRLALEGFDAECSALVAVVRAVPPIELSRPTNCPPWALHELVIHIADSIETPEAGSDPVGDPGFQRDLASWLDPENCATKGCVFGDDPLR
jgi:hypothetical protein